MNLTLFFQEFNIEELQKLKLLNFSKIITKAKELNKNARGCSYCYKLHPKYTFIFYTHRWKNNHIYRTHAINSGDRFCSKECLFQYFNQPKKEEKQRNTTLAVKAADSLALYCLPKELNQIKRIDFLTKIEERLQNYQKYLFCDYCHERKKKGHQLETYKTTKRRSSVVLYGEFCSKKCLKKYVQEK